MRDVRGTGPGIGPISAPARGPQLGKLRASALGPGLTCGEAVSVPGGQSIGFPVIPVVPRTICHGSGTGLHVPDQREVELGMSRDDRAHGSSCSIRHEGACGVVDAIWPKDAPPVGHFGTNFRHLCAVRV